MLTRKHLLSGQCTHEEYYCEIAEEVWGKAPGYLVRFAQDSRDDTMGQISSLLWDTEVHRVTIGRGKEVDNVFDQRGDTYSYGNAIMALKTLVRREARKASP